MSDGGKGSNPRPFSVDQKTYNDNWDKIFKKEKECKCEKCKCNIKKSSSDFQDILSTEDCVLDALKEMNRISDKSGDYITNEINTLDKK
jgi:hypothetical protein